MNNRGVVVTTLLVSLLASGQTGNTPKKSSPAVQDRSAKMRVVPDLKNRVAKFRQVRMPFHSEDLTPSEKKMVLKLVDASRYLDYICWRQVDPEALELYQSLEGSTSPRDVELRRYLWINGSRFDLVDNNLPFVGDSPPPQGAGLYPQGITREQIEQYVKNHPEKRAEIYSSTTVVRWHGSELEGLPYHIAYRAFLEPAAKNLRDAADLSSDAYFAHFVRLRADALLSDDYFPSDVAWLELKHPKFDIIFAPYETYSDGILGVKATYGAAVMVRNDAESHRLETFQKYVADIQDSLPLPERDRPSKHGLETPMEVVDAPFRAGDLTHGYQAVADNLPNDPRIHEQKGSKKIFFKNFLDARVDFVVTPLAQRLMPPAEAARLSKGGYMATTLMHEISHGLGPAFAHNKTNDKIGIREAIGPIYSALEESKADVVGMFGLKWLVDHGVLPKDELNGFYASYLSDFFRAARFGAGEAHGQAEMMEFNYYLGLGGVRRLSSGKYTADYGKMPALVENLAKELLETEATGDRDRAEAWFKKYGSVPPELQRSLATAANVPIDIDPFFSFPRKIK